MLKKELRGCGLMACPVILRFTNTNELVWRVKQKGEPKFAFLSI